MLERAAAFLVAVIVLILSFFFVAAAVALVLILVAALAIRWWWLKRVPGKATEQEFITTEYTVVERETEPGTRLPPGSS